ncbi:MAG: PaaI family thioesterase [Pseudomonadota bacterium]
MKYENLTGLEILQGICCGDLPHPAIAKTIPMRFLKAEHGYVFFEATANETLMNPMDGTHGGFAATVLDSVTGCAVHTVLEANIPYGTIELNVKMMRPVPLNVALNAEGKVINVSRSLGVSEGTLKTPDGKLLAHATCTCMIVRK